MPRAARARAQESDRGSRLVAAAQTLSQAVARLRFAAPVAVVYNPLAYAWPVHEAYLRTYGATAKRVLFLGMNPGPFGMAQTGVPFGEVAAVRTYLKLDGTVTPPATHHPKRPIQGFGCRRSEVSGQRLWGGFASRFARAADFFAEHFVANYCPLAFVEDSGRNHTPDQLPPRIRTRLQAHCDEHLRAVVAILEPAFVIGIGRFALQRAQCALAGLPQVAIGHVLHPSPASPAANRDWFGHATAQLIAQDVWRDP